MTPLTGSRSALALLVLVLLCPACAPDDEARAPTGEPAPSATDLVLERLAARVSSGEGISDATWTADVADVADVLWPDDPAAKRTHHNLANIAGDMAKWLREGEDAREGWLQRDPASVAIHDGFVEAIEGGVEAYRTWVETRGRALIDERFRALAGERPPR